MRRAMILLVLALPIRLGAQHSISIDGQFDDWLDVPTAAVDPGGDPHDTDWFGDGLPEPSPMRCSDVDIIEVRFTNDADSLYGYMRAAGEIGRTSSVAAGHARRGRFYFIFTIDVDSDEATGYRLAEGGYWPDSRGYDMNMEIEFYDGLFNTGHYINHEFLTEAQAERQGLLDLADGIVRLAPGTYDHYT